MNIEKMEKERETEMEDKQEQQELRKAKTFRTGLIIAAAAVAVVAVAVIAFKIGASNQPVTAPPSVGGRGVVATPENIEELREEANRPVEDGYYETRMNVEWKFPSSDAPSTNAYVENSTNNKRTVYFDLILSDTKDLIYSSPFIPVGAKLEKFTLDAQVPAGEHKGIVTYHLVDDEYRELTTVSVSVTLLIEN